MRNVQEQAFVLSLLTPLAQLQQGCLPHFSRLVGDPPLNVKAHCLWTFLQQLRAVIVNFQGSVGICDGTLHEVEIFRQIVFEGTFDWKQKWQQK